MNGKKSKFLKISSIGITALGLSILFQNCAPKNFGTEDLSSLAKVQKNFPQVASIDPAAQVAVTDNTVTCSGSCAITFTGNSVSVGGTILCAGSLSITGNQILCDNNLTLTK